jgi:hypothetical protein
MFVGRLSLLLVTGLVKKIPQINLPIKAAAVRARPTWPGPTSRRFAEILKARGYRGYIVLEYEDPGDPRIECLKYLDELR